MMTSSVWLLSLTAVAALRAPPPGMMCDAAFASLMPLPPSVADALAARGIAGPTPIQKATIPRAFAGESLVLHAETGSGKSLAFLMPTLARLGIAGLSSLPPPDDIPGRVLLVAPTRELAVQLANEAALIVPAPGAVQIVAVGAKPEAAALLGACVVACTAPEMLELLNSEGDNAGVVAAVLSSVRAVVLDELDMLLPVSSTYGMQAAKRKKTANRKTPAPPAEELLRILVETCSAADLQLLAASATVSRPTRLKLARVLRRDPLARWFDNPPEIVRPYEIAERDLSEVPRAVVIPPGVKHFYVRLASSVKLKRLTPKAAARTTVARKLTLKQKRVKKAIAQKAAARAVPKGEKHPLLVSAREAIETVAPASALLFLCRSSGLTVRQAARELCELGLDAMPLHEAIGLEHAKPGELTDGASDAAGPEVGDALLTRRQRVAANVDASAPQIVDTSSALQQRHRDISAAFSSRLDADGSAAPTSSGETGRAPLLVTFEDMARGLHFDAVDAVFIVGMPDSPATYLHLAGRTGRQPVLEGTVVTICPGASHEQLLGWANRLGGIDIKALPVGDTGSQGAAAEVEAAEEESGEL